MTFHNERFMTGVIEPSGGPVFSTTINMTTGGREQSQINWSYPRGRWSCSVPRGRQDQIDYLNAFFRNRFGRGHTFRFKDWADYTLERQSQFTTNGVLATAQIIKTYISGPTTATRKITKPISGTARCWVNNVLITQGGGAGEFSVNYSTGVLTIGATLAATTGQVVEFECEFDVHVRFESDELILTTHREGIGSWAEVAIVEVPE